MSMQIVAVHVGLRSIALQIMLECCDGRDQHMFMPVLGAKQ